MGDRKNHKLSSFIYRTLIILNVLFLFSVNLEQVSAEELTNNLETTTQIETVSEDFENSDDELVEEKVDNFEVEVTSKTESSSEDFLDESAEEKADADLTDSEGPKELSEENTEEDSVELLESELENTSEKELKQVDTDEEEEEVSLDDAEGEELETNVALDEAEEGSEEFEEEIPSAMTASAQSNKSKKHVEVDRIAGDNRYKNAVELSKTGWNSANTVILTNGEKFTDSLTGSPLASLHDAPILLTRADRLPSETLAEIKRLNPSQVIVLGGELSVSNGVLNTLRGNGFSTRRIGGSNRYLLAENIAKEVMAEEGMNRDAFLVSGEVYSDAMSIAPIASSKRLPIFLTKANVLQQTVIDAIPNVNSWTIIGGQVTINQKVQTQMNNLGAKTSRINGENRYEVNRNIINHYGASGDHMYVASGEHFSDATPASVLAARKNSSVLLVKDNNKATLKEQRDFANKKNTKKLTLVGGALTLSKETEDYFNNQNYLVYLDPGHGGWESGAVGWAAGKKYVEKDLNLQVSFKVKDLLEAKGYEVFMSRTNNTYVSLQRRPEQANNLGADIFVSLHHNAMPNSTTTTGIETFYYGSSSKYPPLAKNRPYHNDPARLSGSKRLAELIHGELLDHTGARDRKVKRAAFVVVREARMPAVLLEYGFMSTPADLRVFSQNWYQNKLALATFEGINRYFAI